ncbi:SacI homology domain-containing protein [Dipodascopsis uninucleata]
MRVYLREQSRTLLLATESHALSFQCVTDPSGDRPDKYSEKQSSEYASASFYSDKGSGSAGNSQAARVLVNFTSREDVELSSYRPLSVLPCLGCLGLLSVENDVFLAVITGATKVAEPLEGKETVYRIHGLEFYCLTRSWWDFGGMDATGRPLDGNGLPMTVGDGYDFNSGTGSTGGSNAVLEHPCAALRKLLTDGSFYYSNDFDLTTRMQSRSADPSFDIDGFDEVFMWNSFMISELVKFRSHLQPEEKGALDESRFLTSVIRGFAETVRTNLDRQPVTLTIISRQGCKRAGTRYNARGVDDEGNVANFVETETILETDRYVFSYAQIRGSVPIFWEQDVQLLSAKVNITRAFEATVPAFMAHFEPLVAKYGPIHIINLLSSKPGEYELTQRYHQHIKYAGENQLADQLRETKFDFHVETAKAGYAAANRVLRFIQDDADEFGFFLYDNQSSSALYEQTGVFRTNCLDCLDRTNLIQQIISKLSLEIFFQQRGIRSGNDLWLRHSVLWADNGDQLSKIYAGTGALKTSFTRSGKMSIAGAIADATKSVGRMYINNFVDKGRQNTIDMLLGRLEGQKRVLLHDPINDYVQAELNKQKEKFTSSKEISVFVGTFNLNGYQYEGDLSPWLFPKNSGVDNPDLVIVGFQEIVELTPGQILSADPMKRQFWEHQVSRCLNSRGDYVLLRSGQLVGTALLMYVKESEVRHVRNINGAMKKTGLGGMAGNKGGVAFSCDYASTKLCFITSHFAAGLSNIEDRNHDYRTIANGIRFPRGKTLRDHDTIVWLGDFNYRIDLPNEEVRKLIEINELDELYRNDQLNNQMLNGQVFPFFSEGPVTFKPTYKFDNGTDIYDSSDKARIPAWTDRILTKGSNIKQLSYDLAPLRFSDHRPVYSSFRVTVYTVDEPVKEKLSQELYAKRRGYVGQLLDLDSSDTSVLPPPSTDRLKWWSDAGQSAKVTISVPQPNLIVNPNRPSNPFNLTTQPEFVEKDLMQRQQSTSPAPPIPKKPSSLSGHSLSGTSLHSLHSLSPADDQRQVPPPLPARRAETLTPDAESQGGLLGESTKFRRATTMSETPMQTFSYDGLKKSGRGEYEDDADSSYSPITFSPRQDFPSTSLPKIQNRNQGSHASEGAPSLPSRPISQSRNIASLSNGRSFSRALSSQQPPKLPPRTNTIQSNNHPPQLLNQSSSSGLLDNDDDEVRNINSSWKSLT